MIAFAAVMLFLSPWHGPSFPAAGTQAVRYQLGVQGTASQSVHLGVKDLPQGWIASFCTNKVCSPYSYTLQLDAAGAGTLEFQAIRIDDAAPRKIHIRLTANDRVSKQLDVIAR